MKLYHIIYASIGNWHCIYTGENLLLRWKAVGTKIIKHNCLKLPWDHFQVEPAVLYPISALYYLWCIYFFKAVLGVEARSMQNKRIKTKHKITLPHQYTS